MAVFNAHQVLMRRSNNVFLGESRLESVIDLFLFGMMGCSWLILLSGGPNGGSTGLQFFRVRPGPTGECRKCPERDEQGGTVVVMPLSGTLPYLDQSWNLMGDSTVKNRAPGLARTANENSNSLRQPE